MRLNVGEKKNNPKLNVTCHTYKIYFRPVPTVLSLMVYSKKLKKNGFVFKADLDMGGACVHM